MDVKYQVVLDNLRLLAEKVGNSSRPDIVEMKHPSVVTWDDRQLLLREIAALMRLPFEFRTQVEILPKGVAAQIDLKCVGSVVDIKTCPDLHYYPWNFFAAVCHELCHKYLQYHGLNYKDEVLTDVCAVYLGFGAYMLNGKFSSDTYRGIGKDGVFAAPGSEMYGYLTKEQLFFAHCLVCQDRDIPPFVGFKGVLSHSWTTTCLDDADANRAVYDYIVRMLDDRQLEGDANSSPKRESVKQDQDETCRNDGWHADCDRAKARCGDDVNIMRWFGRKVGREIKYGRNLIKTKIAWIISILLITLIGMVCVCVDVVGHTSASQKADDLLQRQCRQSFTSDTLDLSRCHDIDYVRSTESVRAYVEYLKDRTDAEYLEIADEAESLVARNCRRYSRLPKAEQEMLKKVLVEYEQPMPSNQFFVNGSHGPVQMSGPLEIKTKSDSCGYVIKLVRRKESVGGMGNVEFFFPSGSPVEIDVRFGSYDLKYATGTKWYGPVIQFGLSASYVKVDKILYFEQEETLSGYRNKGHTLTLYKMPNGNLRTVNIVAEDF